MMQNKKVTIAVVCPTFNSSEFIERTLASVFAQTTSIDEVIVSDDGSTDNTLEIVKNIFSKYSGLAQCRLLKNGHGGPGIARNKGIFEAKSSWIAFLDSDDTWEVEKIEVVRDTICRNSSANFICHDEYRIDAHNKKTIINNSIKYIPSESLVDQLYWSNLFSTSAVICKRSLLIDKGVFDEGLMSIQDYDLWLKIASHMEVVFIKKILGSYIERSGNITSNNRVRRLVNELRVLLRYRKLVATSLFVVRIPRLFLSHIYQFIKSLR